MMNAIFRPPLLGGLSGLAALALGVVVAGGAVAAFLAGLAVLRWVTRSTFWAALLAAFTAAVGLAVNANLFGLPQ